MPEVPSNMQEGLAHLELEDRDGRTQGQRLSSHSTMSSLQSPGLDQPRQQNHSRESSHDQRRAGPGFTTSYEHTNASAYQNINSGQYERSRNDQDSKLSPFPKPRDAGPNIPLSDEEKLEVLERARPLVLKSSDPEMQLAWSQDALSWVEVASQSSLKQQPEIELARAATPKVEHQLRVDALNIVNFLADQHHPKAEFMKGMWLEFGKFGYRVDKKEAFMSYRTAAKRGYARAEYRIGMQYENTNNSTKAIEHYQRGVEMGDSASNYRLGMMTLLGQHGMPQDYQRGVYLIQQAADTADENAPQGAYVYGMLLARELDRVSVPEQFLPYDLNRAKLFIEKAAYLGFAKAQLKMAQAYELCQLGCEFEPALSLHYNALAAHQGEPEADMAISKWFLCGFEGVFEKNEELAFTYAKRAAQMKLATAEFAMGYFYEIGVYVPVDLPESEKWYKLAADHGNPDALGRIDSIKKNNTLNKADHEQVAISRIKSKYGSQRSSRPDRFKKATAMPSMAEDRIEIPDVENSYAIGSESHSPLPVVPYPEDDMLVPAGRDHVASPGRDPQSYQSRKPPSLAPIDIGRPGNFDQGANRLQKPGPSNMNRSYPSSPRTPQFRQSSPNQGYGGSPGQRPQPQPGYGDPSIARRDPAANQFQRPERGSSMTPVNVQAAHSGTLVVNQVPARFESVHVQIHNANHPSQRPPTAMSSQSGESRHSSVAPSTASAAAPPRKPGPATFEEMGIPVAKQENDCVSPFAAKTRISCTDI
jgi:TPR repeat protein